MNRYMRGDVVEVLTEREILATLDERGALDGLPFMPEMRQHCGRRFRVARRADRTCIEGPGEQLMDGAVFLEGLRCNGAAHDGCQRDCLLFWKERWLRPADAARGESAEPCDRGHAAEPFPYAVKNGERYYCQSTELASATRARPRSIAASLATIFADLRRREIGLSRLVWMLGWSFADKIMRDFKLGTLGQLTGPGSERSKGDLGLQPGDWVEVRPAQEISATLDRLGMNKGLKFDPEMAYYKGPYQVERRLERIILETTGKMRTLTHTVTLKGVACQGLCAKNCPRSNPIYWREIWLRRVPAPSLAHAPRPLQPVAPRARGSAPAE